VRIRKKEVPHLLLQVFSRLSDTGISTEASMRLRSSPRKYVRYSASVQTDNGAGEGTLFDLSATGCRMQSNAALTPGSYLALHFEVPQTESQLAVEVSVVRWHKDNQFGIEFLRYAEGVRERVSDLIEGREAPAISNQPVVSELALDPVAA
jgi:hypothetical protein